MPHFCLRKRILGDSDDDIQENEEAYEPPESYEKDEASGSEGDMVDSDLGKSNQTGNFVFIIPVLYMLLISRATSSSQGSQGFQGSSPEEEENYTEVFKGDHAYC